MGERAFTFGEGATMLGLTSEPATATTRPTVIILNAGIVHRIGPARNTVELARRLADDGFLVMRFDLTGIGDSESRRDTLSIEDRAAVDIRQAMDHLAKTRGSKEFVLVGLCSGADNAFRVAGEDERVVGAVLIDGYGYRTRKHFLHYYARRVMAMRTNRGALGRLGNRVVARVKQSLEKKKPADEEPTELLQVEEWQRDFPPRAEFAARLGKLVARGMKLFFVYTGAVEPYYAYEEQLVDSVPEVDLRGLVDTRYYPYADHTLTQLESKAAFMNATLAWFAKRFPPSPAEAVTTAPN